MQVKIYINEFRFVIHNLVPPKSFDIKMQATSTDKPVSPNYAPCNGVGTGGTTNPFLRFRLRMLLQKTGHEAKDFCLVVCDVNSEKERLQVNFFDLGAF